MKHLYLKSSNVVFIPDLHGRFEEFQEIIKNFGDRTYIILGDIQDRHIYSRECLEFIMNNNDKFIALFGNHERLFLDFYYNDFDVNWLCFLGFGGFHTLLSYENKNERSKLLKFQERYEKLFSSVYREYGYAKLLDNLTIEKIIKEKRLRNFISFLKKFKEKIPIANIKFIENLPLYIESDDFIASHAPLSQEINNKYINSHQFYWNREKPLIREKDQIYGHNSFFNKNVNSLGKIVLCLDNSKNKELLAFDYKSKQLYKKIYK